ncbi:MAG TPA: Spy/CpxP family protein refolding chaperone [Gemmatimonadaceae bacterium]|nr:Spy/CpxP family protein refolding chaperone [Gemmatimonadaceae bacterium]
MERTRTITTILALALAVTAAGAVDAQQTTPAPGSPPATDSGTRRADGARRAPHARGRQGQQARPGQRRGERQRHQALFRGIALTDAQQAQVKKIRESYRSQFQALRPQGGAPRDSAARAGMRTKAQQLMQAQQRDLRAVLTADQQGTFDANAARMRERMEARMREHPNRGDRPASRDRSGQRDRAKDQGKPAAPATPPTRR